MPNNLSLDARVVWDAQLETAQSGTDYCRVRVASDVGFGERKKALFLDAVLFGKRAVALEPYLQKGQMILIHGELEPARTYDSNGETRVAQNLIVREITLVGAKPEQSERSNRKNSPPPNDDFDDDIPF